MNSDTNHNIKKNVMHEYYFRIMVTTVYHTTCGHKTYLEAQ